MKERESSLNSCFKRECSKCKRSNECLASWCFLGKCVKATIESEYRCFLQNKLKKKKKDECEKCKDSAECEVGTCWGGKCTSGTDDSMKKCFLPECSKCKGNEECSTMKCSSGKCTYGTDESLSKCFLPECAKCNKDDECSTKLCWKNMCVLDTPNSLHSCRTNQNDTNTSTGKSKMNKKKTECEPCIKNDECKGKRCWKGTCTDGSEMSLKKCFLPECAKCSEDGECGARKCIDGKCASDTQKSRQKCGVGVRRQRKQECTGNNSTNGTNCKLAECEDCRTDGECLTGQCMIQKCVDLGRIDKCFDAPQVPPV